jgi:multisubunit Na+/H+ antiporter MnhB subunit
MKRGIMLGIAVAFIFAAVAFIMLQVMPQPMKDSDYLVVGSVATLVALLALFLLLVTTSMKSSDVFFKKRKK